ncbi:MAG TPA: SDR family oxidoreductase [Anaerolineales bacterium]|nr:SDR family oxidoreductase [Anaerolineales bacterium]
MTKSVVITGSTRGIGYGMAEEFLKRGCQIVVSGRKQEDAAAAAERLGQVFGSDRVLAQACDVGAYDQVQALWSAAVEQFGKVDIWINNAGQAQAIQKFWETDEGLMESVVQANLLGTMYGAKAAIRGMLAQGFGELYFMEGRGSNGAYAAGMALYATTKRGGNYLFESLVKELKGTPVKVGALSPGMVVTDLLTRQRADDPDNWESTKKIFNILADKVETVTPWLVENILANEKHGAEIRWLTQPKILWRFMTASFNKRDLFEEELVEG